MIAIAILAGFNATGVIAPALKPYITNFALLLAMAGLWIIRRQLRLAKVKTYQLERTIDLIRDQLESLIESSPSVIYSLKPDEKMLITFVSENVSGMLGYTSEELMGVPELWINNIHPEDKDKVMNILKTLSAQGNVAQVYRFRHKDGRFLWLQDNMKIISDNSDVPLVVIGSWMDVTEHVNSEQALVESEEMFRDMFEKNAVPMLLIEPLRETIYTVNDSALEYFGFPENELKGKKVREILSLPKWLSLQTPSDHHLSVKGSLANGEVREIEIHATFITLKDRRLIFAILHDITEKIRFEKELLAKTTELDNLNKDLVTRVEQEVANRQKQEQMLIHQSRLASMGEMIGAITHQWRQPLNTLALTVQDLEEAYSFGDLNENYVREFVAESLQQVRYMSNTIEDFRNFFKPSKSKKVFDVMDSAREVLSLMSSQLKSYSIVVDCTGDGNTSVTGYPNEFKQAFLNLVNNSKDAIIKKEKKVISVRGREEGGLVKLSISDTGGGIPAEYMDKLFQPYNTTKEKGTGLGLYMAKVIIIDNMGGAISVVNNDQGAEFTIELKKN